MKMKPRYITAVKIGMLFVAAYMFGHFSAVAADYFQPEAVEASADGNWGLSFQQEGEPPVANASAEELAKYDAYYAEMTDEKVLYLTFDAGYENGNMPAILDALKKHQAPATFFVVGNFIES